MLYEVITIAFHKLVIWAVQVVLYKLLLSGTKIIEYHHLVPVRQKAIGQVTSYKSGSAGNKCAHRKVKQIKLCTYCLR